MNKTLIFTATLNEYPNIILFIKRVTSLKLPIDLLIVDDNSKDGTLEFLKEFEKKKFFFKVSYSKKKTRPRYST